jgi:hypothetical protein
MNAINFTMGDSETISGCTNIDINTGLSSVVNGSTKNILCECLDRIPIQARNMALQQITNKLAFDGEAIFKFLNATVLAERIIKNELDCIKVSSIISNIVSIWTEYYILEIFNSIPNIIVKKTYIDNIYSVITITKKI